MRLCEWQRLRGRGAGPKDLKAIPASPGRKYPGGAGAAPPRHAVSQNQRSNVIDHNLSLRAQFFDGNLYNVAGLEINWRVLAHTDTRWRAG